ncbi:hypothetical protein [Ornithobacterium rhinotracheale]|uniref:hypothetical protein n=1 Tax=Ornithobacterium rhinotracheale TaxID=28251 RepID=UPI00129CB148|nr:hypothetical protein [Ornithobacterium rhinotracheale]MRJ09724.1 hypothetical protein [Ornithobacterium rhinotracheale]
MSQVEKSQIEDWELEELAYKILGLNEDELTPDKIEEELMEELNVDLRYFGEIVSRLIPLIDVGKSPVTNELYKGFADLKEKRWIVRCEIKK